MRTNKPELLAASTKFAVEAAAEHVGLAKFYRAQRTENGFTPEQCDEWQDCFADPEISIGLHQSFVAECPGGDMQLFTTTYCNAVKAFAKVHGVPCLGR